MTAKRTLSLLALLGLLLAPGSAMAASSTHDPNAPDSVVKRARRLIAGASGGDKHTFQVADSLVRAVLPEVERLHGASSPRVADALDVIVIACAFGRTDIPAETESLATRDVAIRRASPDSAALGHTLLEVGRMFSTVQPRRALPMVKEALRLMQTHAVHDSAGIDNSYLVLGNISTILEDVTTALDYSRAALAYEESWYGPNHPRLALGLVGIAVDERSLGDAAGARRDYERALRLAMRSPRPDPGVLTTVLSGLVQVCEATGEPALARQYAERGIAAAETLYGAAHLFTAVAHFRLADLLGQLGDSKEAIREAELAVGIAHRAPDGPNPYLGSALSISAECFYDVHMLDSALVRMREAYDVRTKVYGAEHPVVARTRGRLAVMEGESGHPQLALALIETAPPAANDPGAARWVLFHDEDRARIHQQLGHRAVAESLYQRSAEGRSAFSGPRSSATLTDRAALARARYDLGHRDAAFAEAEAVERASLDVLHEAIAGLSDREALDFEGECAGGTDVMLSLAADADGLSPASRLATWDAVMRGRLAVQTERAEQRWSLRSADPEVARRQQQLAAARDSLARLSAATIGTSGSGAGAEALVRARANRDAAERALGEVSPAYRGARASRSAGIEDALQALPRGVGLVGFVRYAARRVPVAADSGLGAPSETRYLALVKSPARAGVDVVPLGPAASLDALVSRWSERCAHPLPEHDAVAWSRYRDLGDAVRARIWDPVQRRLGSAKRVFVVPDGAIASLNLAALPTGRDAWLVESATAIEMLTTERDLVRSGDSTGFGRGLLAFADPAFDAAAPTVAEGALAMRGDATRSALRDADSLTLATLPGSAEEARALADVWRRGPNKDHDARVLVGAEASEAAFKSEAPGHRILHLATHGVSLAGRRVAFESGERGVGGVRVTRTTDPEEARDDVAALALAGATRHSTTAGAEDGWLTSEEVLSLDLSGVEWAVLSGCETGVGDPRGRESVQGLVRAFRLAGARTVIASLWPVQDRAARDWMTRVYQARWLEGRGTAAAVREADLAMLRSRRAAGLSTHPFYWASFVATGGER